MSYNFKETPFFLLPACLNTALQPHQYFLPSPSRPFSSPLSTFPSAASVCSSGSEETREVSQFLYIDPFIFNGPMFPRVGAILCRFRWAGDAVRACCHSVLLRAKAHDLGSALTAIPGEADVPISPLSNTKDKVKIPDGLWCDGRRSGVVLLEMTGDNVKKSLLILI